MIKLITDHKNSFHTFHRQKNKCLFPGVIRLKKYCYCVYLFFWQRWIVWSRVLKSLWIENFCHLVIWYHDQHLNLSANIFNVTSCLRQIRYILYGKDPFILSVPEVTSWLHLYTWCTYNDLLFLLSIHYSFP